ncbi:tRNA dimethylallyltransferase [Haloferula luteola]|uniref:tRNA dimethylallyltransferase n=1 Tax=Haloferula luteola TaxID=595692 RepID=A0A840V1I6_9BACT|nr:tRNA (adenosine(37)-N6)-dimethylallyltransferase MiaA [Haloferula luteola]MBB5352207.1 tRNA dimethylallyltransferase [Haloferula luteola]
MTLNAVGSPSPIFLCGPTASGKSALAAELAQQCEGEVVNADAFQLYHGLETLVAAPSPSERSIAPHHLYGVLSPEETCDAMRYREMALSVIQEIQSRGRIPIVTGGSGLYLKFLTHGPDPLPPGDPELRRQLDTRSLPDLIQELTRLDPLEASRTPLANRRYVSRALEICLLSGRPCSELRDRWTRKTQEIDLTLTGLVLRRERSDLHRRIELRTRQMLAGGALQEVRTTPLSPTLSKAIGVPQIRQFLEGTIDLDRCHEHIAAATRQYAKRQETWFRREKWLLPLPWSPGADLPISAALSLLGS